MGLIVRSSAINAAGVFTTAPIKNGSKVVEYTGPRITRARADELYEHRDHTYLFGLDDGVNIIDGHGIAMFINHACDPNCETDEEDGRVWITAIRDIQPGEELTYDYCLYDGDDDPAICRCGAKNCRGTMYSEAEVKRLKREAQKKTKSATKKKMPARKKKTAA